MTFLLLIKIILFYIRFITIYLYALALNNLFKNLFEGEISKTKLLNFKIL